MDANQLGLFDEPARERPGTADRLLRGRNRQTWARTATAEVTVIDARALREAVENTVTIELRSDPDAEDPEPGSSDMAPASNALDALDALGWVIWPTDGMEPLLEAGAFRVDSVSSEVVAETVDRGTVTWTVTVKLTDVDALRRLAAEAHPEAAGLIAESLAVAWQHAADPFEPMRSIPGIAWRPGRVDVEHMPARAG
jgi:hypothetical protein